MPSSILLCCFCFLLIHSFSPPSTATIHSNETDRLALLAIKSRLDDPSGVTSSWNDSVPLCDWTGVSCGRRHQRVTKLDLRNQSMGGELSPSIGNLSFLRSIHLEDNNFHGDIPNEVGLLSRLETLILANNTFSGTIPKNLSRCSKLIWFCAHRNNLRGEIPTAIGYLLKLETLSIRENQLTGQIPTSIGNLSALQALDVGSNDLSETIPYSLGRLRSLLYLHLGGNKISELSRATNKFSSLKLIGQGRHGLVYKGSLGEHRTPVAVKVINLQQKGGSKSFISECKALRNIRHRNLVGIITICSSIDPKGVDFKALVYEYMENGSLEEWLHKNRDQHDASSLSLIQRLNVAIDVAFALEYLHHHCEPQIVHGDLKPCNVLLDHDMVAHVGDFGLSKFLSDRPLSTAPETKSSSIGVRGTVGYVAPEYGMGNEVSMLGDVYSFGILLLEMFTGKRPTDSLFNDGLTLHDFAKMALPERVMEIVEPSLLLEARTGNNNVETYARCQCGEGRDGVEECLVGVLRIGVVCSIESPANRMEINDVVAKLCAVRESFLGRRI